MSTQTKGDRRGVPAQKAAMSPGLSGMPAWLNAHTDDSSTTPYLKSFESSSAAVWLAKVCITKVNWVAFSILRR